MSHYLDHLKKTNKNEEPKEEAAEQTEQPVEEVKPIIIMARAGPRLTPKVPLTLDDLGGEVDPTVDDTLKGVTLTEVQDHDPNAHTLASHSTKAHSELTGVTENQHHARQHAIDSASDHTGEITDTQHGSRGSGLHSDSHVRNHNLEAIDHPNIEITSPAEAEVLTYEDATALWKNKAPTGAGDLSHMRYRMSGKYHTFGVSGAGISTYNSANRLYAVAFFVPVSQSFDRICCYVSQTAVGNARIGIYADDGTVYPGALILDAGTVSLATTGSKEIVIDETLAAGLYWLVIVGSIAVFLIGRSVGYEFAPIGNATLNDVGCNCWYIIFAYDVLPGTFPAGATAMQWNVVVALRKA